MASSRIRGITIELNANTIKLTDALKDVDQRLKTTQSSLKDVNRLLKMDPGNTELLAQKQRLLESAIGDVSKKLEQEKEALQQLTAKDDGSDAARQQQEALKREIEATALALEKYQDELKAMPTTLSTLADMTGKAAEKTRALSAAAAAGLTGLIGLAINAGKTADDLNTLSRQTGFTTEQLQEFQYASDRIDVSMEAITGAAAKLTKQIASENAYFSQLNIALKDTDGNTRAVNDIFFDTLNALSQVENETDRDVIAMSLFGRSANELAGIIDDGGAALRTFGQEAEDAGLILSQDALDAANKFQDAVDGLKAKAQAAFLSSGAALAENLIPALEKLLDVGGRVLSFIAGMDSDTLALITTILAAGAALSPVLSAVSAGLSLFNGVSGILGTLAKTSIPGTITALTGGVSTAITSLSGVLPVLAAIAAAGAVVVGIIKAIQAFKAKDSWNDFNLSTLGKTEISAGQAAGWWDTSEVQTMTRPDGTTGYYVSNSDYRIAEHNAQLAGRDNVAANYMTVNVDHINDLQDLIEIQKQAQLTTRMG